MALVSTDDRHYKNIAQAIRNKLGTEELLLPEQMAGAINSIGGFMKNYQGTTIHADDTYYCNMVSNRNKIEVLGQTIQNLVDDSNIWKTESTFETKSTSNVALSTYGKEYFSKSLLKTSTKYTIFIDYEIKNNTLENYYIAINQLQKGTTQTVLTTFNKTDIDNNVKFKVVTTNELFNGIAQIFLGGKNGSITFKNNGFMILEGDWTNKEVSYVPFGLNYPETTEVVECGKNLLKLDNITSLTYGTYEIVNNKTIRVSGIQSYSGVSIPIQNLADGKPRYYRLSSINKISSQDGLPIAQVIYVYQGTAKYITINPKDAVEIIIPIGATKCSIQFMANNSSKSLPVEATYDFNELIVQFTNNFTQYEPYTERRINIDKPLASVIDTIRDRYYVKDGKKYHEQHVKEIVFDGSEDWVLMNNDKPYFSLTVIDIKLNTYSGLMGALCNRFIECTPNELWNASKSEGFTIESARSEIRVRKSDITTVENWKTWLSTNNTTVLYQLATPITTEIETEDWYSFDGQTNITTTNDIKIPMDLDIPTALVISSGKEM